ncbi:hypothetical protein GGR51DRAFT_435514 [Nemania sp. FL0031]|nr:hypothetical protein GGR51DRAFT_435514 [Nemania sp. FL0031]
MVITWSEIYYNSGSGTGRNPSSLTHLTPLSCATECTRWLVGRMKPTGLGLRLSDNPARQSGCRFRFALNKHYGRRLLVVITVPPVVAIGIRLYQRYKSKKSRAQKSIDKKELDLPSSLQSSFHIKFMLSTLTTTQNNQSEDIEFSAGSQQSIKVD